MHDHKTHALEIYIMHAFMHHLLAKKQLVIDLWSCVCPLHMLIHIMCLSHARAMVPHVISSGFITSSLLGVL